MIKILDNNYSTRLCYKLLDDKYLDENGKIKEEYEFKLNFPEFGIVDSKIQTKEGEKFDTYLFLPEGEGRKGEGGLRKKGYFKFSYKKVDSEWYVVGSNSEKIKKIELPTINYPLQTTYYPLITIITVVYNGEKYLEETIQSVTNQTYPNVEYIIIDGGSTDGTVDIIKKYEDKIDYWVSEKDKGIYDAMNKGIDLASGEWINFMNAGDKFVNNQVLVDVDFEKHSKFVLLYGNKIQNRSIVYPLDIKKLELGEIMACHQSMFFNKDVLKQELYYNLKYKIYGDYELVNRIYIKHPSGIKYIDITIADFAGDGVSSVVSYQKRKDKYLILYEAYGFLGLIKGVFYRLSKGFL